jgi:hypothetical protein
VRAGLKFDRVPSAAIGPACCLRVLTSLRADERGREGVSMKLSSGGEPVIRSQHLVEHWPVGTSHVSRQRRGRPPRPGPVAGSPPCLLRPGMIDPFQDLIVETSATPHGTRPSATTLIRVVPHATRFEP